MGIFQGQIKIIGKHADIMQKYCKEKGSNQDISFRITNNDGESKVFYLFETRINIYMCAGMLGIIYNRKSDVDKSTSTSSSVMTDMIGKQMENLLIMYRYMVLGRTTDSPNDKIKRAFSLNKTDEEEQKELKELEDYVRGGLEIIDERFKDVKTYDDLAAKIFDLVVDLEK